MSHSPSQKKTDSEIDLEAKFQALSDPSTIVKELDNSFHNGSSGFKPVDPKPVLSSIQSLEDYKGFFNAAIRTDEYNEKHAQPNLVDVQFVDRIPPSNDKQKGRQFPVTQNEIVIILSDSHDRFRLPVGMYEWTKSANGWKCRSQQSKTSLSEQNIELFNVIIARVSKPAFKVQLSFPQFEAFYQRRAGGQSPLEQYGDDLAVCSGLSGSEGDSNASRESVLEHWSGVMHSSDLRTLDGCPIGIVLELELVINSPEVIVSQFLERCLPGTSTSAVGHQGTYGQPAYSTLSWLQGKIVDLTAGIKKKTSGDNRPAYTKRMLIEEIRNEVFSAVQSEMLKENSDHLVKRPRLVRDKIAECIRNNQPIAHALEENLGVRLVNVRSSFYVPSLSTTQKNADRLSVRRARLTELEAELAVEKRELEVDTRRFTAQIDHQQQRAQEVVKRRAMSMVDELEQKAEIVRASEKLEKERLSGKLSREKQLSEFERQRRLDDAEADLKIKKQQIELAAEEEEKRVAIQKSKIETAVEFNLKYEEGLSKLREDALQQAHHRELERIEKEFELQMRTNGAVMEQRIGFLQRYAGIAEGMDENKLLVMALTQNPELAGCYVAAVQAKGQEDMIRKMEVFREQLISVHGKESQLVHKLWTEGVKQIGHVLGKIAEKE